MTELVLCGIHIQVKWYKNYQDIPMLYMLLALIFLMEIKWQLVRLILQPNCGQLRQGNVYQLIEGIVWK